MPDFSSLLDKHAGEAKKPKALPAGDYPAVIKRVDTLEAPKGKEYNIVIRVGLGLIGWPDSVDDEDRKQEVRSGEFEPIDLAKRNLRRDYYDHRLFDLDQLLADCGIEASDQSYRELFPQLIGCQVVAEVAQYISSRNEVGNQVNNLRPAA